MPSWTPSCWMAKVICCSPVAHCRTSCLFVLPPAPSVSLFFPPSPPPPPQSAHSLRPADAVEAIEALADVAADLQDSIESQLLEPVLSKSGLLTSVLDIVADFCATPEEAAQPCDAFATALLSRARLLRDDAVDRCRSLLQEGEHERKREGVPATEQVRSAYALLGDIERAVEAAVDELEASVDAMPDHLPKSLAPRTGAERSPHRRPHTPGRSPRAADPYRPSSSRQSPRAGTPSPRRGRRDTAQLRYASGGMASAPLTKTAKPLREYIIPESDPTRPFKVGPGAGTRDRSRAKGRRSGKRGSARKGKRDSSSDSESEGRRGARRGRRRSATEVGTRLISR